MWINFVIAAPWAKFVVQYVVVHVFVTRNVIFVF